MHKASWWERQTSNLLIREENKAGSLKKRALNMPIKDSPFAESICQVAKPHRGDVSAENVTKGAWRASSTSAFRQFPGALERDGGPGTDDKR